AAFRGRGDALDECMPGLGGPGAGGDAATVGATLAAREARYLELFDYEPPFVTAGAPPPLEEWARRSEAAPAATLAPGEAIQGVGGCAGTARGQARAVGDALQL